MRPVEKKYWILNIKLSSFGYFFVGKGEKNEKILKNIEKYWKKMKELKNIEKYWEILKNIENFWKKWKILKKKWKKNEKYCKKMKMKFDVT